MYCHNKYHRLWGLNNGNLFSHNSGGWKFKIKVLAGLISPEAFFLGLQKGRRGSHRRQHRTWRGNQCHWALWQGWWQVGTNMYREAMRDASEGTTSICRGCWAVAWAAPCWGIHYRVQASDVWADRINTSVEIILPILSHQRCRFVAIRFFIHLEFILVMVWSKNLIFLLGYPNVPA